MLSALSKHLRPLFAPKSSDHALDSVHHWGFAILGCTLLGSLLKGDPISGSRPGVPDSRDTPHWDSSIVAPCYVPRQDKGDP